MHGGISKKNLVAYHLHMIKETLSQKFHPYSILTRDTMVGFVIYRVSMNASMAQLMDDPEVDKTCMYLGEDL